MWEAIQFAVKHQLSNLAIIVDRNMMQAMDYTDKIMDVGAIDLQRRLSGFGVALISCNGHDVQELAWCLRRKRGSTPNVVIAETMKGRGMPCALGRPKFHYRMPACLELINNGQ